MKYEILTKPSYALAEVTLDPGEKIRVTFTVQDVNGLDVTASDLTTVRAFLSGPTSNSQTVISTLVPKGQLVGPQPFVVELSKVRRLEFVGEHVGDRRPRSSFGTGHQNSHSQNEKTERQNFH